MQKSAIYARYSTEEQKATSIEDQVRRAREKAEDLGYSVPDELVFFDANITGTAKGLAKRSGYEKLLRAWERKEFDALVVDEVSRLARDAVALAHLQERVENSGVRLLSTDGIDSVTPGWQLQFGFCGVMASHFVRETGHRVIRAMVGQLERGFMIAAPPFGYTQLRETEAGTVWLVDEAKAAYVREIFCRRRNGASLSAIALWLNEEGVPTPRKSKDAAIRYWRPGTIFQMLRNTIYRGLFIWNGSPFTKAKRKRGGKTLAPVDYPRPALRIIDDETWFYCNQEGKGRIVRGGGRHLFAGLVQCSECEATLTVATGGAVPSLYCAQCQQAAAAGVPGRSGTYISANGLQALLTYVLERMFAGEAEQVFRERLRTRLEGGNGVRILELKRIVVKHENKLKMLLRMLTAADTEDPAVEAEYRQVLVKKRELAAELARLEVLERSVDKVTIERQLEVNPRGLTPRIFGPEVKPEQARAALRHIFPSILYLGKRSRFSSEFILEFAHGIALAELSDTAVVDGEITRLQFSVTGGPSRPSRWLIEKQEIAG